MSNQSHHEPDEWFATEGWLTSKDQYVFSHTLFAMVLDGCTWLTERKVQLFEVACARRVIHLLPGNLCSRTIDLAEAAADEQNGTVAGSKLEIYSEISAELDEYPPPDFLPRPPLDPLTSDALELAATLAWPDPLASRVRNMVGSWPAHVVRITAGDSESQKEVETQIQLLHEIFGNPFRPIPFSADWRTDTAAAIAKQMYESRDFGSMPTLAAALQNGGCDSDDVLNHCRSCSPHVRGCWVIDLVLGKK